MKNLPSIPVSDANSKDNAVLAVIMSEDETITCCESSIWSIEGSEDQANTSGDGKEDSANSADYVG